jgi:hypothetical protein
MTWHNFFTLPFYTYSHNLFYAYATVWILQGGYVALIARNWVRAGRRRF